MVVKLSARFSNTKQARQLHPRSSESYKRTLKCWGIRGRAHPNEDASPADRVMSRVQQIRDVDYIGPLAG